MITGRYAPDGQLWISARWPTWREGGVGVFDGTKWTTYANSNSPLPSDYVHDIAFDGSVAWLATNSGIVRVEDGEFTIFDRRAIPELPTNEARDIDIDSTGGVWVALGDVSTGRGGVAHYNGDAWEVFTNDSGLPWTLSDRLKGLAVDSQDRVWITHASRPGTAVYDGATWTILEPPALPKLLEYPVADDAGRIWFATDSGVWMLDGDVWTRDLPRISVSSLAIDSVGTVWAGSAFGHVYAYDGIWEQQAFLDEYVEAIAVDPEDHILIIGRFASHWLEDGVLTGAYNGYNTGLTDYWVESIHFDAQGHAWFCGSIGLSEFDGTAWNAFNVFNQGSRPWPFDRALVADAASDASGNLWVATRAGLGRWDGDQWQVFDTSSGMHDYWLYAVTVDSRGWVWVGSDTGASYYDGSRWTYSLQATPVGGLVADDAGNVYATGRGGLRVFDGEDWTTIGSGPTGPLPDGHVHEVAVDGPGNLWVATGEGLAQRDIDGAWTIYTVDNSGIPANNVVGVVIDHAGLLWVGGRETTTVSPDGGVASFDGTTWTRYMKSTHPLSHYFVQDLVVAPDGDIFISAYTEGIDVLSKSKACPADVDGSGSLDVFDFLTFQNLFDARDPTADFDGDGVLTIFDFLAFQTAFADGCD